MKNTNNQNPRPLEYAHWAYNREKASYTMAKIRRQLEETEAPGWNVVAEHPLGNYLPYKIMLFCGDVLFGGTKYRVLFLEIWYYQPADQRYQVDLLHCDIEVLTEV